MYPPDSLTIFLTPCLFQSPDDPCWYKTQFVTPKLIPRNPPFLDSHPITEQGSGPQSVSGFVSYIPSLFLQTNPIIADGTFLMYALFLGIVG